MTWHPEPLSFEEEDDWEEEDEEDEDWDEEDEDWDEEEGDEWDEDEEEEQVEIINLSFWGTVFSGLTSWRVPENEI